MTANRRGEDPCSGDGNTPANSSVKSCTSAHPQKKYNIEVLIVTRAGDIPIPGVSVMLNGKAIGAKTNKKGKVGPSPLQDATTAKIEATYVNKNDRLRKEVFTLTVSNINVNSQTYTLGKGKNKIEKVQDVLGSGDSALKGDKDFVDEYNLDSKQVSMEHNSDGSKKLIIVIKLATLSLNVEYLSQNSGSETIEYTLPNRPRPVTSQAFTGSILCMPTSALALVHYWEIKNSGAAWTRGDLMQHYWDKKSNPSLKFPRPWQIWSNVRPATQTLITGNVLKVRGSIPGVSTPVGKLSIPGTFADSIKDRLVKGEPAITSTKATGGGHIMLVRGAVVNHKGKVQWLIFNDPYGILAGPDSVYGILDIADPVGLRGTSKASTMNDSDDVKSVQDALRLLGYYKGAVNGNCSETSKTDPTVIAIRALQGGVNPDGRIDPGGGTEKNINKKLKRKDSSGYSKAENEKNKKNTATGAESMRGKHVYYNGKTEGKHKGHFRLRPKGRFIIITRKTGFTKNELSQRLTPGQ